MGTLGGGFLIYFHRQALDAFCENLPKVSYLGIFTLIRSRALILLIKTAIAQVSPACNDNPSKSSAENSPHVIAASTRFLSAPHQWQPIRQVIT
jgi:hypothetical protein